MAELPEDVRFAIFGYNPKTGKAFTEAEARAVSGGYLPSNYVDIVDYSFDPERGELTVTNKAGMSSTLGAKFKESEAGKIVPDIERMNEAGATYGEDVAYDEFGVPMQYSTSKTAASKGRGSAPRMTDAVFTPGMDPEIEKYLRKNMVGGTGFLDTIWNGSGPVRMEGFTKSGGGYGGQWKPIGAKESDPIPGADFDYINKLIANKLSGGPGTAAALEAANTSKPDYTVDGVELQLPDEFYTDRQGRQIMLYKDGKRYVGNGQWGPDGRPALELDAAGNIIERETIQQARAAGKLTTPKVTTAKTTTPTATATASPAAFVATGNVSTGKNPYQPGTTQYDKFEERRSAFDILYNEFDAMGLGSLVKPLEKLIIQDVGAQQFAIELRASDEYKARFSANDERVKKGLRVLTPREYLTVEDAYRQTLRTYGLKQFDNDQYVRQFIANDVSAAELSDRVATAVQRVQNADPAISRTLRDYYGITNNDLVAYVLDPNQQLQKIQRQVAAAEIGTAARKQGLEAGVAVSEQLAAQGITEAQAQKGYATIADILPTAEKLSQIYGTTLEGYDQAQAEQEVFNTLASAQRRRQRLVSREVAEFSGQAGVGRGSLGTAAGGQY